MARIFFIAALVGILTQNFSRIYILVQFAANRTYIEKNLCLQKNVPGNCCKGKCYLHDKLDKQDKKEHSCAPVESKSKETILFCHQSTTGIAVSVTEETVEVIYIAAVEEEIMDSVFQPPEV